MSSSDHTATQADAPDAESVNAMLSPQDGTFGQRYVPDEVHVPNPDAQAASKEREANQEQQERQEARQQRRGRDAEISNWASSSRGTWQGEPFQPDPLPGEDQLQPPPLPDDQGSVMTHPPPAYSDVAQSIGARSRPPTVQRYSTMGNETERFFPASSPQDLGGGSNDESQPLLGGEPAHPQEGKDAWRDRCKTALKILAVLLVVLLGVGFIMSAAEHMGGSSEPVPIKVDPDHAGVGPSLCPLATVRAHADVHLEHMTSFAFDERAMRSSSDEDDAYYIPPYIRGDISIRRLSDKASGTARVELHFQATNEDILEALKVYSLDGESVQLHIPEWTGRRRGQQPPPCLVVTGTIWVSAEADLESFFVYAEHLNLAWEEGTTFRAGTVELNGALGDVRFSGGDTDETLKGRELRIDTRTGSVRGDYPLMDLLSITTTTGSVDATVAPKEADSNRKAAELRVHTWTGSIKLDAPALRRSPQLPERDYQTLIESQTGSVTVRNLPHGSRTSVSSSTARIRAIFFPQSDPAETSEISVRSNTGSVEVAVAPHSRRPKARLTGLSGEYTTTTGSVRLVHLLQWEGSVRADTGTGSLKVDWPGLATQNRGRRNRGIPGLTSSFYGTKGDGQGTVEVHTRTGSVRLEGADVV